MKTENWASFYELVKNMREAQRAFERNKNRFAQETARMYADEIDDVIASREKRLAVEINPRFDLFK